MTSSVYVPAGLLDWDETVQVNIDRIESIMHLKPKRQVRFIGDRSFGKSFHAYHFAQLTGSAPHLDFDPLIVLTWSVMFGIPRYSILGDVVGGLHTADVSGEKKAFKWGWNPCVDLDSSLDDGSYAGRLFFGALAHSEVVSGNVLTDHFFCDLLIDVLIIPEYEGYVKYNAIRERHIKRDSGTLDEVPPLKFEEYVEEILRLSSWSQADHLLVIPNDFKPKTTRRTLKRLESHIAKVVNATVSKQSREEAWGR